MKTKRIASEGTKTYVLVFDKDDEVASKLLQFAKDQGISAAFFNALGGFEDVTFGWFDRELKEYQRIVMRGGMEVLSFVGNLAVSEEGEPRFHAHVVVNKSDGTAHGGHFLEGHVWPTMEMVLTVMPERFVRKVDDETGIPLIDLEHDRT
jgi:predicted DNA-binding protein with PD1-like motif